MALADRVDVEQTRPYVPASRQRADHRTKGPGGTAAAADDLAEVLGVYAHFQHPATADPAGTHPNVVGMLDDATDQVLERFFEHVRPRSGLRWSPQPWARPRCRPLT